MVKEQSTVDIERIHTMPVDSYTPHDSNVTCWCRDRLAPSAYDIQIQQERSVIHDGEGKNAHEEGRQEGLLIVRPGAERLRSGAHKGQP